MCAYVSVNLLLDLVGVGDWTVATVCSIYVPFMFHVCSMHVPIVFYVCSIHGPSSGPLDDKQNIDGT